MRVGNLDADTVNPYFSFINLQSRGWFLSPSDVLRACMRHAAVTSDDSFGIFRS